MVEFNKTYNSFKKRNLYIKKIATLQNFFIE